ncbi:hypothetical protein ACWDYH_36400 [Nocardia goodfellowii]
MFGLNSGHPWWCVEDRDDGCDDAEPIGLHHASRPVSVWTGNHGGYSMWLSRYDGLPGPVVDVKTPDGHLEFTLGEAFRLGARLVATAARGALSRSTPL